MKRIVCTTKFNAEPLDLTNPEFVAHRIASVEEQIKIQCYDGNWNYDAYMHGMANGLICAVATLKGEEPQYLEAPKQWIAGKSKAQAASLSSDWRAKARASLTANLTFIKESI